MGDEQALDMIAALLRIADALEEISNHFELITGNAHPDRDDGGLQYVRIGGIAPGGIFPK